MKNSQKGSATTILLIVIIFLIIGFGFYFYQTKNNFPDITSDVNLKSVDIKSGESNESASLGSSQKIGSSSDTTKVELLNYSGTTGLGLNFSIKYQKSWVYYKFSCNADGVAFWPKNIAPDFSQGSACSMNSSLESAPIILNSTSKLELELRNSNYQTVFDQMKASIKY